MKIYLIGQYIHFRSASVPLGRTILLTPRQAELAKREEVVKTLKVKMEQNFGAFLGMTV
jgi:hypothetical protein